MCPALCLLLQGSFHVVLTHPGEVGNIILVLKWHDLGLKCLGSLPKE